MAIGYIFNGRYMSADEYFEARAQERDSRSNLPGPRVISDCIEIKSMVDGQIYTSKAALRAGYRAQGYIEVGNEELKPAPKPQPDKKAVRETAAKALSQVGVSVV